MKEININIEGYNVNGICVGCLNYNRKMFYDDDVKECFKVIGNIDVPDGLTIQVCWECLATIKNIIHFQSQILAAYDVLIAYSKEHTFLNSPKDLTQHAHNRLTIKQVHKEDTTIPEDTEQDINNEIKVEAKDEKGVMEFEEKNKKCLRHNMQNCKMCHPRIKDEETDTQYSDFVSQDQAVSSDEDIQLSQIKQRKQKRDKKKKKKDKIKKSSQIRKLKNLPEEIVELYTMSEEEMWSVRASDVSSEGFRRLRHACEHCVIGFNTLKLKEYHDNGKHKPKTGKSHQCDVCKAYFLTKDNLAVHRALHLSAYRCRQCGLTTTMKRLMLEHECAKCSIPDEFPCTYCDKVFSSKSKLSYHRSTSCRAERPQCDCCGKVFANKMTLKYHLKLLPVKKEDKLKEKLYIPCKGCNKVFQTKKSYRAHVVIHEGHSYPCPICGKLFMWKRNLSRHTRAHRDRDAGATHQCRECNKTFASRDCYNNHMRLSKRHASEATYVHECNYCGKKFPTKWCMVDHIDWDHLKRVKYQCSVCFKAFKTAKIMVAHVNNIHGGRRREPDGDHLCEVCGKSYKTVKRLKAHVWAMHTQRSTAKSYKCSLCAASFTWQTSIYKHMKMMHTNKRTKTTRAPPPAPSLKQEAYDLQYYSHTLQPLQQNIV